MKLLAPAPSRMLLFLFGALAFASLAPTQSAVAQPISRRFAKDGCREDAVRVPQAILCQPITEKDLAAVKDWVNQGIADLRSQESGCRAQHEEIEEAKEEALDAIDSLADDRRNSRVTRKEQRMAAVGEERERQAVAAPGGPTQDLQRLVRFVSTWTQP